MLESLLEEALDPDCDEDSELRSEDAVDANDKGVPEALPGGKTGPSCCGVIPLR